MKKATNERWFLCRSAFGSAPAYGSKDPELPYSLPQPLSLIPLCGTRERTGLLSAAPVGAALSCVADLGGSRLHFERDTNYPRLRVLCGLLAPQL